MWWELWEGAAAAPGGYKRLLSPGACTRRWNTHSPAGVCPATRPVSSHARGVTPCGTVAESMLLGPEGAQAKSDRSPQAGSL